MQVFGQKAWPKPFALIEYNAEDHLIFAFVKSGHLYVINCQCILEVFKMDDLIKAHTPSEDELMVFRVKLVKPI